jgi:hypothetical protein
MFAPQLYEQLQNLFYAASGSTINGIKGPSNSSSESKMHLKIFECHSKTALKEMNREIKPQIDNQGEFI